MKLSQNDSYLSIALSLIALAVWLAAQGSAQEAVSNPPLPRIHEELIAEASAQSEIERIVMSTATHVLWIEKRPGNKQALWLNGKQLGGEYDEVRFTSSTPECEQVAFTARRGSRWVLVVNGQERSAEYDEMFVPDITLAGRYVVPVRKGRKWQMLVDGQPAGATFDAARLFRDIPVSRPLFDSSGSHYAFLGSHHGKWMTFMDGNELGAELEWVRHEVRDIHGKFAYPFQPQWVGAHILTAAEVNGKWCWVADGRPEIPFDRIGRLQTTDDGKHYAYGGVTGLKGSPMTGSIVRDGKIVATYPGTPDKDEKFVGVWPLYHPERDGISDPRIAADGTVFFIHAEANNLVVSSLGMTGPALEIAALKHIVDIAITPDGKHIAYAGGDGSSAVLVRDEVSGPLGVAGMAGFAWIKLSPDGAHVAVAASEFRPKQSIDGYTVTARVVVDGKADSEFQLRNDETPADDFQFSENGKHYAYQIHTMKRLKCRLLICTDEFQSLLVVDGVQLHPYEHVLRGMRFIRPNTVEFLAHQEKRLLLVTCVLSP